MSTRAHIGLIAKNEDVPTVVWIYCHWDGYPAWTGKILTEDYTDPSKVWQLIALGDISVLDKRINPSSTSHTFRNPEKGTTISYYRDRKEEWLQNRPAVDVGVDKFKDVEYAYLFNQDERKWTCYYKGIILSDKEFKKAIEIYD